jgi:hypothetical protein
MSLLAYVGPYDLLVDLTRALSFMLWNSAWAKNIRIVRMGVNIKTIIHEEETRT